MKELDKVQEALEFLQRECQLFENSSERVVEKVANEALAELKAFRERLESEEREFESTYKFKFYDEWVEVHGTRENIECLQMYLHKQSK